MNTLGWVLFIWLMAQICVQWYYVGRPRAPKTTTDALLATIELGVVAYAIVVLAS